MYVITVQFTIDQEHWGRFLPLMYENACRSREEEPGCRQFDVCVDPQREGLVFLYELYVDRAAFDGHLRSLAWTPPQRRSNLRPCDTQCESVRRRSRQPK